jgi:molecular chaperone GrpE
MTESQPPDLPAKPGPESGAASNGQPAGTLPGEPPGAVTLPAASVPEEPLAAAKREAAANYDRYLRAVADLENFRRRATREKEELRQFATVSLLQGILPVLDNLQLGLDAARQQADATTIANGVAMVLEQLKAVLTQHGLKEVNPVGQRFDPHRHESISHQPSPEVPEEHVLQVIRIGYTIHGRLLRPASVVVSSGPAKKDPS